MNTAVVNVLNKVLGEWIEDLNPDDFKLSFLKGSVTLKNLKVKISAIDKFGLPFVLRSGYVGKIVVNISWSSITNSPLRIEISDVFILLGPKPFESWNSEMQKQNVLDGKLSILENYELITQAKLSSADSPGYIENLIENIIDNLQISIDRVYIRYEHNLTASPPFAMGVRIGSMSTHTTNSRFEKEYVTGSTITYRLTSISDLAVYMDYNDRNILSCTDHYSKSDTESLDILAENDLNGKINHKYILKPVGIELRLVMNKVAHNFDIPKIRASLISTDIKVGLLTPQITSMFKLLDFWTYFEKFQSGILSEVKQNKLDVAKADLYREIYKEWSVLKESTEIGMKQKADKLREEMVQIESGGLLDDLICHRQVIKEELNLEHQEKSKRKEIEKLKSNIEPGTYTKLVNFFSWKSEADQKKEEENRLLMIEAEEKILKDIIVQKEQFKSNGIESPIQITEPDHIVKILFDLNISELSLYLGDNTQGFIKFGVYELKADFGMRPNSVYFGMKVGITEVIDLVVKSEDFPYLFKGGELLFEFDQYPKTSVKMQCERAQVILNSECIFTMLESFQSALGNQVDLSTYVNAVAKTTAEYAASGQKYISEVSLTGIQSSIDLEISMKAPVIYYPFDIHSLDKPMLVLDLGTIHCTNSQERIKKGQYDVYTAQLDQLRCISVWKCKSLDTWEQGKITHFIHPFNFSLQFKNCKTPASKKVPNFILKATMSSIDLLITDKQIRFSLEMMEIANQMLERFYADKSSFINSAEISVSEDSSDILEVQGIKDKMKTIGDILTTRVELDLKGISIILSDHNVEILTFYVLKLNSTVLITSEPSVKAEFYLERIELLDRREGIEFNKVVCNPQIYKNILDEYVSSSDMYQITGEIIMKPNEDLIDIFVDMNDLRVIISADLTSFLMKILYKKLAKFEKYFKSKPSVSTELRPRRVAKSQSTSYLDRRVSMRLSNFEVWIPKDPKDLNTKVLNLHYGINATYVIAQQYIKYYDDKGYQLSIDYLKTDDEATLEIIHLGIVIGYVDDDEVFPSEEQNNDFMNPCRITANYKCSSQKVTQSSNTMIDVNLESISLVVGFKDIKFLLAIAKELSLIEFGSTERKDVQQIKGEIQEDRNDRIEVVMMCDAMQITLVEDTGIKSVNLLHNEMSNFNAMFVNAKSAFNFQFETILICNYFNMMNAAWEPLLEDWTFKILAKQNSPIECLDCSFISEEPININITYSMVETIAILLRKIQHDIERRSARRLSIKKSISTESELIAHGQFFYNIYNKLGVHISLWLDISTERWEIEPNSLINFGQDYIDKLYSSNRLKSKNTSVFNVAQTPAAISIKVEGYHVVKGLLIEGVEPVGFILMSDAGKVVQCMLKFKAEGIQRRIHVESAHCLMNNTDLFVSVKMKEENFTVEPNECVAVPFRWLEESQTPVINCIEGLDQPINKNAKIRVSEGFISLEVLRFETSSEVPQTVYQFNPVFTFLNLFPGNMTVCIDNQEEPILTLRPGQERSVTEINPFQPHTFKFTFSLQDCEISTDFLLLKPKESYYKLEGDVPASNICLNYDRKEFRRNTDLDLRFRPETKLQDESYIQDTSMVIQAYPQYIINNHTDYDLIFGKKTNMLILNHSIGIFNSLQGHLAIRMPSTGKKNKWSSTYNVTTAGVAGLITLDNSNGVDSAYDKILLGIRIEIAPHPMIKTSIIHLMPRFIILNTLEFPIYIRQFHREKIGSVIQLNVSSTQSFQIEHYRNTKMIQISADGEKWSSPFNIENLEDFQVRFPALPSQYLNENEGSGIDVFKNLLTKKTEEDWYKPTKRNHFMHYVRVCIMTEDEATLFINFVRPKEPEFSIWNNTNEGIVAYQLNCIEYLIPPKTKIPWAYDDLTSEDKRVVLKTDSHSESFRIEKLKQKKQLGPYKIEVIIQGVIREMRIIPDKLMAERKLSIRNLLPEKLPTITSLKLVIDIGCVGLSIIDSTPSEKLFFSIMGIRGKFKKIDSVLATNTNTEISVDMTVNHIQLDNMDIHGKMFPVIMHTKDLDQEEPTPFFQAKIKRNSSVLSTFKKGKIETLTSMDKWSWVEIQLQEIKLQVNQEIIDQSLIILNKLMTAYDQTQPKTGNPEYDEIVSETLQKCLNSSIPVQIFDPLNVSRKAYFEYIHLGAMKFLITFRHSNDSITHDIMSVPVFLAFRFLFSLGKSFINISDSPLYFREILMRHSFQTIDNISWLIIKNYIRQGILQFYKILGSSDLIGNPIGFVDKLGTGVFEFLNEPRKGILKGPKGFVTGVGKGVKSLVGNLISAGFGSVGKITGSLYNVVREVGRDGESGNEIMETDNAILTVYDGFKGGAIDLARGVKGIFTKPWKGAKKNGAKGFFKGVGAGLLGVVTSPFAAVLRVGSSIASGVAKTGTLIAKGKVKTHGRLRFPRHFGARRILEIYDNELAQAQELLRNMRSYSNESMVYYMHIKEKNDIITILTTHHILLLLEGDLIEKSRVQDITACEVHKLIDGFYLCIATSQKQTTIKSSDFSSLAKMYTAIISLPTQIEPSKHLKKIRVKNRYGRGCFGN